MSISGGAVRPCSGRLPAGRPILDRPCTLLVRKAQARDGRPMSGRGRRQRGEAKGYPGKEEKGKEGTRSKVRQVRQGDSLN